MGFSLGDPGVKCDCLSLLIKQLFRSPTLNSGSIRKSGAACHGPASHLPRTRLLVVTWRTEGERCLGRVVPIPQSLLCHPRYAHLGTWRAIRTITLRNSVRSCKQYFNPFVPRRHIFRSGIMTISHIKEADWR